ncbi:unnamed protein product [Echinostoma caproni]|uniref:G_PROTEIN_RECEP_F1_2 domain-containing protein n=1 Tax=Echinostoma caproni TaxID=27848 RepID=A0A183AD83_9TREM|nr:unnamed protein product [Echinostoma caproni]
MRTCQPRALVRLSSNADLMYVTSVWLTVAFTSDRYMMICHPFTAKRWCTVRLAKCIIFTIYLASVIYGIPRYFEYTEFELVIPPDVLIDSEMTKALGFEDTKKPANHTEQRVVWYDLSEFGRSESFRSIYHLWSWNLLVVGIPLLTIAIMNSFLIREIPAAISHISWAVIPPKETQKLFWFLLNEIGNLLIVVNSAINLIPYYIFSRRFRRQFTQMLCPFRIVRDNGLHCVYIPRWLADNLAKDASDNACTTGALGGGPPTNKIVGLRQTLYAYGLVRHMSIIPPTRPNNTENNEMRRFTNRSSSTRPERAARYSGQPRNSYGTGRCSQVPSQHPENSFTNFEPSTMQATILQTHERVEGKYSSSVVHAKDYSHVSTSGLQSMPNKR